MRYLTGLFFLILISACERPETEYLITIKTRFGDMHAILYDQTPEHKENFLKLAREGFYDSLLFHRVIPGFMIQGGDPLSKNRQAEQPLGTGGPGYTIPAEFNKELFHVRGALSAARLGDNVNPQKESSGSQFYIVQGKKYTREELTTDINKLSRSISAYFDITGNDSLREELITYYQTGDYDAYTQGLLEIKDDVERRLNVNFDRNYPADRLKEYTTVGGAPHLDDNYTVFGRVIDGLDVMDKITAQRTGQNDRPVEDILMTIEVEELPKNEITEKYGYTFPHDIK